MKKLVFMFVACATMSLAVSFSSCGNGAATDSVADSVDSSVVADSADTTVADTTVADTAAADTANA